MGYPVLGIEWLNSGTQNARYHISIGIGEIWSAYRGQKDGGYDFQGPGSKIYLLQEDTVMVCFVLD